MAEGRSSTGIARQLWITEGTVEKHVHSILTKLVVCLANSLALALPGLTKIVDGCSPSSTSLEAR
jgi:hypothetical protein